MRVEYSLPLEGSTDVLIRQLAEIPRKELTEIVGAATSAGEALLQRSGTSGLDAACQCHFGAQLGHPWTKAEITTFPLRWWNDKSRSLTPGFIGELRLRAKPGQGIELSIAGQYHPRAHLFELVPPSLLARMANAVTVEFLQEVQWRLLLPVAA